MHHRARYSCTLFAAACCAAVACAADPGDPLKTSAAYQGSVDSGNAGSDASFSGSSTGSSGSSASSSGSGSSSGSSGSGSGGPVDASGEASSDGGSSGFIVDAAVDNYTPPSCPTCPLKVEYFAKDPPDAGPVQAISFDIAIANGGSMTQLLSELTVRYWFMGQNDVPNLKMECYYAKIGMANVSGTFTALAMAFPKADTYLEVSFSAAAGSIAPNGDSGNIQLAIHSNYSGPTRFVEDNDYSFDPTKTMSTCGANQGASPSCPWDHITLYRQGTLVWGIEPGGAAAGGDAGGGVDGSSDAAGD